MSEDSKAMFQSKNFTLPDGWILNEPQRSFNGGFGTAGIKKIIDHTRKMFKNIPGTILNFVAKFYNHRHQRIVTCNRMVALMIAKSRSSGARL